MPVNCRNLQLQLGTEERKKFKISLAHYHPWLIIGQDFQNWLVISSSLVSKGAAVQLKILFLPHFCPFGNPWDALQGQDTVIHDFFLFVITKNRLPNGQHFKLLNFVFIIDICLLCVLQVPMKANLTVLLSDKNRIKYHFSDTQEE